MNQPVSIDESIRELIRVDHPDAIVVGWSGIVEFVVPGSENRSSICRTIVAHGQLVTTTIGQHTLALAYHKGSLTGETAP